MTPIDPSQALARIGNAARMAPGLEVLIVYGSRARGEAHPDSDWDFGFLAANTFDPAAFLGSLVEIIGSDRIDLTDLAGASGLLRYRAARDGLPVFEARPRLAEKFCLDATRFWCEVAPIVERGYADVLTTIER